MSTIHPRYNLKQFESIIFNGFNINISPETIQLISQLSTQVGSPTYIKTPVFNKKEQPIFSSSSSSSSSNKISIGKKKKGRGEEIGSNEDWDSIRTFNETVIVKSDGILSKIQKIQGCINKLSENTYTVMSNEIFSIIHDLVESGSSSEDLSIIGNSIFEVASNNRFYSKLYANLYTTLIQTHQFMKDIFDTNYNNYMKLFENIECADPNKDYDYFCEITKQNESRKSISAFFINLSLNGIIPPSDIFSILKKLFEMVLDYMVQPNKKSEVDEITEIIVILYNKQIIQDFIEFNINSYSFKEIIEQLATTKIKTHPSLTSKSIFKFMDLKLLM